MLKRLGRYINSNVKANWIEKIQLEQEQIIIHIIKIPIDDKMNQEKVYSKLDKAFKYIESEEIKLVSVDNYFIKDYKDFVIESSNNIGFDLCFGRNLFFTLVLRILKKLLKSKGLDINQIDMAIFSNGNSEYELEFIKYLSPHVKYLTYISGNYTKARKLIDDIFNNLGISVRICSDIRECIKELGLIINLTDNELDLKNININKRLIVFNVCSKSNISKTNKANISILNDIVIDISQKIKVPSYLNNEHIYRICEMYILSELNKLYLLKQCAEERDLKDIYRCFKENGFKIKSLEGIDI